MRVTIDGTWVLCLKFWPDKSWKLYIDFLIYLSPIYHLYHICLLIIYISICHLSICYLSFIYHIHLSIVYLYMHLSSFCLPTYQSIYLSTCLSVFNCKMYYSVTSTGLGIPALYISRKFHRLGGSRAFQGLLSSHISGSPKPGSPRE